MDLMQIATQLLSDQLGIKADSSTISSALSGLLGDGEGGIDLAALAGKLASSGELGSIVSSWLGDGANSAISAENIMGVLGEGEVENFASKLGTDSGSAASALANVLPQLMDKGSSGGSLLDSAGGIGGLMSAAKSFLS